MGKSYGTCYHKLKGDGIGVTRTDIRTRDNEECLSFGSYCKNCTLAIYDSGAMEDGGLKDLIAELKDDSISNEEMLKIIERADRKAESGNITRLGLKKDTPTFGDIALFISYLVLVYSILYRLIS